MMAWTLGVIGGSGMLGSAIVRAILEKSVLPPERLWIANRTGSTEISADFPEVNVTTDAEQLVANCDVILLAVPPAAFAEMAFAVGDRLVISVMAGISIGTISEAMGTERVIRAMSSPAASVGLAYSPWCATAAVTEPDAARTTALFSSCGLTDRVESEEQIELFTAMTGPVPGFVALFAEAMATYARARGIAPEIADRAIRQLFLGAGTMMAQGEMTPADHVQEMVDYAGATAAGLNEMQGTSIVEDIARGLDAAVAKTRAMG